MGAGAFVRARRLRTRAEEAHGDAPRSSLRDMAHKKKCAEEKTMSDSICAICIESCRVEDHTITLSCGHGFHATCLLTWVQQKPSCPICVADISNPFALSTPERAPDARTAGEAPTYASAVALLTNVFMCLYLAFGMGPRASHDEVSILWICAVLVGFSSVHIRYTQVLLCIGAPAVCLYFLAHAGVYVAAQHLMPCLPLVAHITAWQDRAEDV